MRKIYNLEEIIQQELKLNDIYQGCTIDTDYEPKVISTYGSWDEALKALAHFRSEAFPWGGSNKLWYVSEFAVEEYEADDDGEFVSGSNFQFAEFSAEANERLNKARGNK